MSLPEGKSLPWWRPPKPPSKWSVGRAGPYANCWWPSAKPLRREHHWRCCWRKARLPPLHRSCLLDAPRPRRLHSRLQHDVDGCPPPHVVSLHLLESTSTPSAEPVRKGP